MSSARDDILARVRAATEDIQEKDPVKDVPIPWAYNQPTPLDDVPRRPGPVKRSSPL